MKRLMLVAVVALFGCGPSFAGHFTGTLTDSETCSDGSSGSVSVSTDWTIAENGSALTIATSGNCTPFRGTAQGNTATIDRLDCPPSSSGGFTFRTAFTGGDLTLMEPVLTVNLRNSTAVLSSGSQVGTCSGQTRGSLTRVAR